MNAREVLQWCQNEGFTVKPEGDGLRVTPSSRLTQDKRHLLRIHKAELLSLLVKDPAHKGDPRTHCAHCTHSESQQRASEDIEYSECAPSGQKFIWDPNDLDPCWRERFEERAAIMQEGSGLSREDADRLAVSDILAVMARS